MGQHQTKCLSLVILLALGGASCSGDRGPLELVATIPNPDPDPDENFGRVVRTGRNFVVPVELDDPGGIVDAGSVYLFDGATGALVREIPNPSPRADDRFGEAVVSFGGSFAVAAPNADAPGAENAGTIYVFSEAGALTYELRNPEPMSGDRFGFDTIVKTELGPAIRTHGPSRDGTVWIVDPYEDPTDRVKALLLDPDPASDDDFGAAVFNVGGSNVLVTAPLADSAGVVDAGAAYLYEVRSFNATLIREIPNPVPTPGAQFGRNAGSVLGDIVLATGGGEPHLYVFDGQTGDQLATGPDSGSLYFLNDRFAVSHAQPNGASVTIYDRRANRIVDYPNPDPQMGDGFGDYVVPELFDHYMVGVPANNLDGLRDAGAMYRLHADAFIPYASKITSPSPQEGAAFGTSFAALDGAFYISAPREDDGTSADAGAIYVFDGSTMDLIARIPNPEPGSDDQFGSTGVTSVRGVVSENNLAISAIHKHVDGASSAGTVYLYRQVTE